MPSIRQSVIESALAGVQKPARYIGLELNSIVKDGCLVRMAISYPDLYEVGMSNSGIRILYDILNKMDDLCCERVFAVADDFERSLRDLGLPLYTLETYTPLHELDCIGFNVAHELLHTNILQILDLGKVPIRRTERKGTDPLVIAGGASVSNPFPLSDFIDAFFIGDGEDGVIDLAKALQEAKRKNLGREEALELIAGLDGFLIPSRYKITFRGHRVAGMEGPVVKKRVYRGSELREPRRPVVPNIRIVQERVSVEVARGCVNFCSFCHAGFYDLPYRCFDCKDISAAVMEMLENTGYNEVTLSSLSISDYRRLGELVSSILPRLTEQGVSISLPSLRVDRDTLPVIREISGIRRTSLTFAVESASEEIRGLANKRLSIDELLEILDSVYQQGWRMVKLYFMIGLPGCDICDEAEDIISLLKRILNLGKKWKEINVTLSPFVPKPHTPFQHEKQMSLHYFEETVKRIKSALPRKINIKNHDVRASLLEGIFSRGDNRLGEVIYRSYRDGCRLDSWQEHFRFDIWKKNMGEVLPFWEDMTGELNSGPLPWEVVNTGFESIIAQGRNLGEHFRRKGPRIRPGREAMDLEAISSAQKRFELRYEATARIRLSLSKRGLMRFVPHIDFVEIVKRGLRMTGAPVAMTQGFNKRERISTGFPVPLGIESESELFDIELYGRADDDLAERLSSRLPPGIDAAGFRYIEERASLMALTGAVGYRVEVPEEYIAVVSENCAKKRDFPGTGSKGQVAVPYDKAVLSCKITGSSLDIVLYAGTAESLRIDRVCTFLTGTAGSDTPGLRITKTAQFNMQSGEPLQIT